MELQRPNPDDILKTIEAETQRQSRGKLKIFFGYAAGVGKTYAMLKAARKRKSEGTDVALGYIEPHSRPETMRLAEGFEAVPVTEAKYHEILLREMDLAGVLERKPDLALVDEFAHTNAEGSRHSKRYQDVEELLNAGIDVYTTVNVQHIESLCDIVASITGILVRERIPDRMFDMADEVQLVDIEPRELMKRLEEGRIYRAPQARRALEHFFTEEKLTALREIALRRTADRVNLISERAKRESGGEYFTEEKIAVGLSSSPSNPKIIRAAARMAMAFRGELTGIYVETPDSRGMSVENRKRLKENIHLAEQLGAKVETISGEDIPFLIAEYARAAGVSKLVIGRSNTRRRLFYKPSFAEKLTALAPNIDIYIIPDTEAVKMRVRNIGKRKKKTPDRKEAAITLGILAAATLMGFVFERFGISEVNIITMYIFGVMLSGVLTSSRFCSLSLSLMSVLVFNYCFTEPKLSLKTYNSGYTVTFLITFLAAVLSSSLALKLKKQAGDIARVAYRTKVLLDTNQQLQNENDIRGIGRLAAIQLTKLLSKSIVFYLACDGKLAEPEVFSRDGSGEAACPEGNRDENEKRDEGCSPLRVIQNAGDGHSSYSPSLYTADAEKAVASWVFKNNKRAGATTGTLGSAACYYLAIRGKENVYGVIGIGLRPGESLESFENNLVFSVLSEAAAAMERETLRRMEEKAREQAGRELLRANLLRSISHDLRTPLTSIMGNADMLLKNQPEEETRKKMYADIYDDSMWLIHLVENLLSVTRIENGTMKIRKQAELLEDILKEALRHVNRRSVLYNISLKMEDELQLVRVDSRLIIQVIINLVDNAVKYTPPGSGIVISARKFGGLVQVSVADDGEGIPDKSKPYIFDMFYTVDDMAADSKRSLGLGLALCKAIVRAHGGEIKILDNYPKGSIFRFTVEAEEITIHE